MKRGIGLAVVVLLLSSCQAKKGDKGDTGIQGTRGPGQIEVISGIVPSDAFNVVDGRLSEPATIQVFLSDGVSLTEMPYYLPSAGVNAFYLFKPGQDKIEIYNAKTAAATQYIISMILP